jgi:hypothetical protein
VGSGQWAVLISAAPTDHYQLPTISAGESVLSDLLQYIASIALLIAILLVFSVAVYLVGKLRGKK